MSRLLITAPTEKELSPFKNLASASRSTITLYTSQVGAVHTLHALHSMDTDSYDCVIQCGIAGAIDKRIPLGEAVIIRDESWGDMGVYENGSFVSITQLGLFNPHTPPYKNGILKNTHILVDALPNLKVSAVTVAQITTSPQMKAYYQQLGKQIETMEGAAFHLFCLSKKIPFVQVRAISNYAGERNKTKWQIENALHQLEQTVSQLITSI